jgi:hypothetical protein
MKELYYIDCEKFCGGVEVENGIIINACPIAGKFVGQPLGNLTKWCKIKFGWVTLRKINDK